MPFHDMKYVYSTPYDDFYNYGYLGAEFRFAWLPRICDLTGKFIWLKKGYCVTRMIMDPGDTLFEYRWHDKNAHIIWKLKQ